VARAVRRSFLTEASEYAEAILVAVLVALFFKTYVVEAYGIPSGSMEPHLLPGDHIVVNKFVYGRHDGPWARLLPHRDVGRGDVVVFRYPPDPSRDFVKRVMGLPGETLQIANYLCPGNLVISGDQSACRRAIEVGHLEASQELAQRLGIASRSGAGYAAWLDGWRYSRAAIWPGPCPDSGGSPSRCG